MNLSVETKVAAAVAAAFLAVTVGVVAQVSSSGSPGLPNDFSAMVQEDSHWHVDQQGFGADENSGQ